MSDLMVNARSWVKHAQWRVFRYSQWVYQFRRNTLVRYTQMNVQLSMMPEVLAALNESPVDGLTLENRVIPGDWVPVSAWFEEGREDGNGLRSVRIYQAIRQAGVSGEDGPYLIEDGCRYKVSFTFYWEALALPAVPPSESGVSWSLENIRRDEESGLWSCMLVKRERQVQDTGLYGARMDAFRREEERSVLGIREGAGHEADGEIPDAAGGVIHEKGITKNEDCTHDVRRKVTHERPVAGAKREVSVGWRVRRESVTHENQPEFVIPEAPQERGKLTTYSVTMTPGRLNTVTISTVVTLAQEDVREVCRRTVFEHAHANTDGGQSARLGEAPAAAGGLVVSFRSELEEDGSYTNTREDSQELGVLNARREVSVGWRVRRESVTHVNQPVFVIPEVGLERGKLTTYSVEVTPGGLNTVTISTVVTLPEEDVREVCRRTVFEHAHANTDGGQSAPLGEAPGAAGGLVVSFRSELEEDGSYTNTREDSQELPVLNARREVSVGWLTRRDSVTHVNQPEFAIPEVPRERGKVTTYGVEVTPGGLNNVTISSQVKVPADDVRVGCRKTIFEHMHSNTDGGTSAPLGEAPAAAGGLVVEHGSELQEDGSYTNTKREVQELAVAGSRTLTVVNAHTKQRVVVDMNQAGAAEESAGVVGSIIRQVTSEKTPGGRFNNTVETREAVPSKHTFSYSTRRFITRGWHFYNVTYGEMMGLTMGWPVLPESANLSFQENEFGLFSGTYEGRWLNDDNGSGGSVWSYDKTGLVGESSDIQRMKDGTLKRIVRRYVYNVKRSSNVSSGWDEYAGDSANPPLWGSVFRELGNDWYFYQKITSESYSVVDVSGNPPSADSGQ